MSMRIILDAYEPLAQKLIEHAEGDISFRVDSYDRNYDSHEALLNGQVMSVTLRKNRWDITGVHRVPDTVEVELVDTTNRYRELLAFPEPAL